MVKIASIDVLNDQEIIFQEGDFGDCMYLIDSGKIELSKYIDGIQETIEILMPGDIFGEFGFITKVPRPFTAKALGHTTVKVIDSTFLDQEYSKLSQDFQKILLNLATRLLKTTNKSFKSKLRRSDERIPNIFNIKYEKDNLLVQAMTENISLNGLFIKTYHPYEIGQIFDFDLDLPKIAQSVKVKCQVCWTRKQSKDPTNNPLGMGVKFLEVSKKEHLRLKKICKIHLHVSQTQEKVSTDWGNISLETISIKNPMKPPIFFAPGFSTTLKMSQDFRYELAKRGYPVLSFQYPRNWLKIPVLKATLSKDRLRPQILSALFTYLSKNKVKNLIVLGHSCAAIDLTEVIARKNEGLISTIILANPAGMTSGWENQTYLNKCIKLGQNFHQYFNFSVKEGISFIPNDFSEAKQRFLWLLRGGLDFFKNPVEGGKDIFDIATKNIGEHLLLIKKNGINTILYLNKDRIFPLQEIMKNANSNLIPIAVYSGNTHSHHSILLNNRETIDYIEDLIQFQEVVNTLSHQFPNANIIDSMLKIKIFNLDVIHPDG